MLKIARICEECDKPYYYKRSVSTFKHCNKCRSKIKRKENKLRSIKYLGGKCKVCGYNKCHWALVFHHTSDTKDFKLGSSMNCCWDKIKNELDKCILLCANCHAEQHHKEENC